MITLHSPRPQQGLITRRETLLDATQIWLQNWKLQLAKLAEELHLDIPVCHYPPGTSKWNKGRAPDVGCSAS